MRPRETGSLQSEVLSHLQVIVYLYFIHLACLLAKPTDIRTSLPSMSSIDDLFKVGYSFKLYTSAKGSKKPNLPGKKRNLDVKDNASTQIIFKLQRGLHMLIIRQTPSTKQPSLTAAPMSRPTGMTQRRTNRMQMT